MDETIGSRENGWSNNTSMGVRSGSVKNFNWGWKNISNTIGALPVPNSNPVKIYYKLGLINEKQLGFELYCFRI